MVKARASSGWLTEVVAGIPPAVSLKGGFKSILVVSLAKRGFSFRLLNSNSYL